MKNDIVRIEVNFPVGVDITNDEHRMLDNVVSEICERYERANPGRVMWAAGFGSKITQPLAKLSDDEPIPFDSSVFEIECCEREDYDWACATCGKPQGEHRHCIVEPEAGDCEYRPVERADAPERPRGLVPMHVYLAAVRGRQEMRQALREARAKLTAAGINT